MHIPSDTHKVLQPARLVSTAGLVLSRVYSSSTSIPQSQVASESWPRTAKKSLSQAVAQATNFEAT